MDKLLGSLGSKKEGKEVIELKGNMPTNTLMQRMTKKRLYQMKHYWEKRPEGVGMVEYVKLLLSQAGAHITDEDKVELLHAAI